MSNMVNYLIQQIKFNFAGLLSDFFFICLTNTYLSSLFNYFDLLWGLKLLN